MATYNRGEYSITVCGHKKIDSKHWSAQADIFKKINNEYIKTVSGIGCSKTSAEKNALSNAIKNFAKTG